MTTTEEYNTDAKDRLAKAGGTLKLVKSNTKLPPWQGAKLSLHAAYHPHYRCTLTGPGGSYTFDFWDSINAGETGEPATEYDVIACLEWNCPPDFADFCADFGYDEDSRKAYKAWTATLAQCRALHRVFPSETARLSLAEIQ